MRCSRTRTASEVAMDIAVADSRYDPLGEMRSNSNVAPEGDWKAPQADGTGEHRGAADLPLGAFVVDCPSRPLAESGCIAHGRSLAVGHLGCR